MENVEQQLQEVQQPENHETRYELIMVAVFAVVAIPMFSFFFGKTMHKQALTTTPQTIQVVQEEQPTPTQISIVPVLIKHKQDIDDALKMVDGTDTTAAEQQLSQVDSNASSFSQ